MLLTWALFVGIFTLHAGFVFETVETADKLKDKDLTFAVTFDRGTVNADYAKGDPLSTTMREVSLLLRGTIGFDGKPGFQPQPGEDLTFDAVGNANPHQGTAILWICTKGYNPNDGEKRGNIALLHLVFQQGERQIDMRFYECEALYFDWRSSVPPLGGAGIGRVSCDRKGIGKDEWHQVALTWSPKELAIYLNGELKETRALPVKVSKTADLVPESGKSFIGVKKRFYEDTHKYDVALDDVKIYSRPLTMIEIRNQFLRLVKSGGNAVIQDYGVTVNGVDRGPAEKEYDMIEAELDFSALPEKEAQLLKEGKLELAYELQFPSGKTIQGKWLCGKKLDTHFLSGITEPGNYTLTTWLDGKPKIATPFLRPDLSFVNNGLGDEDEVPPLWKDYKVEGRTVTLWNRVYQFGKGPYPESITVSGQQLLDTPPIITVDGKPVTDWQAGKTEELRSRVTFTGTGKGNGFTLSYRTKVEYDGLISTDFVFHDKPVIAKLTLSWQVAKPYREFLMVPTVQENSTGKFSYLYPGFGASNHSVGAPPICKQLWLVSAKKGGFCYNMPHDANWIYDPNQPVFFADKNTGECSVAMVNREVTIPEGASYSSMFIATPVRPLMKDWRGLRFGDVSRGDAKRYFGGGGLTGTTGVWVFEPHPTDFAAQMKNAQPKTLMVYGGADALTEENALAIYFKKYRMKPRGSQYRMPYHRPNPDGTHTIIHYNSVPVCNNTSHNDFTIHGITQMLSHPAASPIWCIGYDLCGSSGCSNHLHGCGFYDKFGREISTLTIVSKRDLVRRSVVVAHRYGVLVYCHAQRDFYPPLHGMADVWQPGEDISNMALLNPYCMMDDISDARYRSEYNSYTLGVAVNLSPSICQMNHAFFKPDAYPYTVASLAMVQLYDLEYNRNYLAGKPTIRLWDILEHYGIWKNDTERHVFYEQQEILSSDPEVGVTYYKNSDGRYLIFLANRSVRSKNVTIDMTKLTKNSFEAFEEYYENPVQVTEGKFTVKMQARNFQVIAFPRKYFYPHEDSMNTPWGVWTPAKCDSEFTTMTKGIDGTSCLAQVLKTTGGGCFLKSFPIIPGKTYLLQIMAKHSSPGNTLALSFTGRIGEKQQGGLHRKTEEKAGEDWQKLSLQFKIPTEGKWGECDNLLVLLSGKGKDALILFDDFKMEEME
ncbi:MAG: LamG domain-containing protein [Lentisphaerae bacterium]|nr:LamG domain-containing protein [Lentisphaerota bacterium]